MPSSGFQGSLTGPKVDVDIDMGNPLLNITVDGFLKIGAVRFFLMLLLAEELQRKSISFLSPSRLISPLGPPDDASSLAIVRKDVLEVNIRSDDHPPPLHTRIESPLS